VYSAVQTHRDWIANEVLATTFEIVPGPALNGKRVRIGEIEVGLTLTLA